MASADERIEALLSRISDQLAELSSDLKRVGDEVALGSKRVLNVPDLAMLLGVGESRIRRLVQDREITYHKAGNGNKIWFRREDVEAWQSAQRFPSEAEFAASEAVKFCARLRREKAERLAKKASKAWGGSAKS